MMDFSFEDDRPKRKLHNDLLLRVEEILPEEDAVVGTDLRTNEPFKVSLASADEMAKHFVSRNDSHRTFEERLANASKRIEERRGITEGAGDVQLLHVEVGSVLGLENVRTFNTPDGESKTAAVWPKAIVRSPLEEDVLIGTVQATHYESRVGQRIDMTVVREDAAQTLQDFDLREAFSGEWNDLPLTQTGVVVSIRNARNETTVASLTTPYRKYGEPSLEAALDAPQGTYQLYAAAVVAAATGARSFDDLKINAQVNPRKAEIARKIYDLVAENPDNPGFEITVMPMAKTQFIPGDSLTNFMRDYHGTRNGKPMEGKLPNPAVSYQGKGFVESHIAMSRDRENPDTSPASARMLIPDNKFSFAEIGENKSPRKVVDLGRESVVRVYGETYGANAPQAKLEADHDQSAGRKKTFDHAPGL